MSSKPAVWINNIISLAQMVAGSFIVLVFGVCTLMLACDAEYREGVETSVIVFFIIADFFGLGLIRASRKRAKLAREFKKYVSVISTEPTDSIGKIADVTGKTMEEVMKNLELMIKRSFFVNAHINHSTNCIVFGNGMVQNGQKAQSFGMTQMPRIEYVSICCKYCAGVSEVIKGQSQACKYCGMTLK